MSKVVLVGINAKYIHTNLAIRCMQKYVQSKVVSAEVLVREWNINQRFIDILRELYEAKPDILLFSMYIWNVEFIFKIIREIKKLLPTTRIVVGGPEVMYRQQDILKQYPEIEQVLQGDGEIALYSLLTDKPHTPIVDLDEIPFPYDAQEIERTRNQILYYESSRGCTFGCAYCLSSIDRKVRYFSLERVKRDIAFFLQHKVTLVKFVDRTFNINPERALAIWQYIYEKHNGITTFHFEIAADLLTESQCELLAKMPKGAVQFEVGIQSANPQTLEAISRQTDLQKLKTNLLRIKDNIHVHVDLIAGLPLEDLPTFGRSFDYAMSMRPEMLQLGFLKILSGTEMAQIAKHENYLYLSAPPYEITQTPWLSFKEIMILKDIDKTVDIYYNSGRQPDLMSKVWQLTSPFKFFVDFSGYLRKTGVFNDPRRPEYYARIWQEYKH